MPRAVEVVCGRELRRRANLAAPPAAKSAEAALRFNSQRSE
jgi:hypothetical protein